MDFHKKIVDIQHRLNAPKKLKNTFGKYNYRSCEGILEALKPLLAEHDLFVILDDEINQVGDRFYVKSIAKITDGKNQQTSTAYAREALTRKGMDDGQLSGATSSYARKYALSGLLAIDDGNDLDAKKPVKKEQTASEAILQEIIELSNNQAISLPNRQIVDSQIESGLSPERAIKCKLWLEKLIREFNIPVEPTITEKQRDRILKLIKDSVWKDFEFQKYKFFALNEKSGQKIAQETIDFLLKEIERRKSVTPEQKEKAAKIRESAQRADDPTAFKKEMARADEVESGKLDISLPKLQEQLFNLSCNKKFSEADAARFERISMSPTVTKREIEKAIKEAELIGGKE